MTSILDQYEQASQRATKPNPLPSIMTSSGYISMEPVDEKPMFSKQSMNFNPSDLITHLVVANEQLVVAMANDKLVRMNLKQKNEIEEISLSKYCQSTSTKLSSMFLDPLGYHLLLSFTPKAKNDGYPELLYLHRQTNKLKQIAKSRNHEVTEVGWNFENQSANSSGPILLGTSLGNIIETEIGSDFDKLFQTGINWRQVFDIGKGKETPITGIEFNRVQKSNKYFIIVTTPRKIYQFNGTANVNDKPLLQSIFASYLNEPEKDFRTIPSSLNYSKMQFFYDDNKVPKSLAWMTGSGLYFNELNLQQNLKDVFKATKLINYPTDDDDSNAPLSFVMTEFHALIMFTHTVKIVSLLSQELVQEDKYSNSKLKSIVKDPISQAIWIATEKKLHRYKVTNEERFVWKIYCDMNEFALAKRYCNNNLAYIDQINIKHADYLFEKEEYERSAEVYAETLSSFESICMKFIRGNQYEALKIYLHERLRKLSESHDQTPISMLVIWMVEIFQSEMSALRRSGGANDEKYFLLLQAFELFMLDPIVSKCMRRVKRVVYNLMADHGDRKNIVSFYASLDDYESVIKHHISNNNFADALGVLTTQQKPELFYQFIEPLLKKLPKATVNSMISAGPNLKIRKLLPSLLCCKGDDELMKEIIRYLEFMWENFKVRDRAVHNYLLTLYAKHQPHSLMGYLARQGTDLGAICFDVNYALRLCSELNLTEVCVKLSALLGLWESAVDMALTTDVDLAKQIADRPEDGALKKKLWLKIAEHVIINNEDDVNVYMGVLDECELLKLEDVLSLFPDNTSFEKIRGHVSASLKKCTTRIAELTQEMEDACTTSRKLDQDLEKLRSRKRAVSNKDVCELCSFNILLRPFYVFPCGHKFHEDCLHTELLPNLDMRTRLRLDDLKNQRCVKTDPQSRIRIKNEICNIMAEQCYYCGDHMIESINKPFISEDDWERIIKEWE